jgi:threonine dehydrogenase-like Zn-dependent dehydrogenase
MRLTEALLMPVPGGLPPREAALTEPMAVGLHAVEKARIDRRDVPLVIGCGPVGLAVIAALRLKGLRPIVAADFSPRRRKLAETLGADVVVDPGASSPYQSWKEVAVWDNSADAPPQPPWVPGPPLRPAVIFECVGLPGIIDQIICSASRMEDLGSATDYGAGWYRRRGRGVSRACKIPPGSFRDFNVQDQFHFSQEIYDTTQILACWLCRPLRGPRHLLVESSASGSTDGDLPGCHLRL